jgi:hypothetical protein
MMGTVAEDRDEAARKRASRRTVLWLALLAASIYLGFIAMGVLRAQ